jgi:hypothetical protein
VQQIDINSSKPHAVVCNLASGLDSSAVLGSPTSREAVALLLDRGFEVNPMLLPLMQVSGDTSGAITASFMHEMKRLAASEGLLKLNDSAFFHLYTDAVEKLLEAHTKGIVSKDDVEASMTLWLEMYEKKQPVTSLNSEVIFCDSFEKLNEMIDEHVPLNTNTLFFFVIEYSYIPALVQRPADHIGEAGAGAPLANTVANKDDDDADSVDSLEDYLEDNFFDANVSTLEDTIKELGPLEAGSPTRRDLGGTTVPKPGTRVRVARATDAPTPTRPAAPATTQHAEQPKSTHRYFVAIWPGHEKHVYTHDHAQMGETLDEASVWTAFRAAPTVDAAFRVLVEHAPREFYMHGDRLLKNKALQLKMERKPSKLPVRTMADFTSPSFDFNIPHAKVLAGAAGIGKTCFAEAHGLKPYYIKTLDMLAHIPEDCDLLIFDDMRFDEKGLNLSPEAMINLLDTERPSAIMCRHYDGEIPALPRIFTTNLTPPGTRSDSTEWIFPEGAG